MIDSRKARPPALGTSGPSRRRAGPSPGRRRTGGPRSAARRPGPLPSAPAGRHRLPPLLRKAWHGLNQAFRHRTARAGLTPDQYTVLRILSENPKADLSQGQLAEAMSSDPNTIASLLCRMERQGWLARRKHPEDGRVHCLELRPAGAKIYHRMRRLAQALQQRVLAPLPERERERFLAQLELVSAACWRAARERGGGNGGPPRSQA